MKYSWLFLINSDAFKLGLLILVFLVPGIETAEEGALFFLSTLLVKACFLKEKVPGEKSRVSTGSTFCFRFYETFSATVFNSSL